MPGVLSAVGAGPALEPTRRTAGAPGHFLECFRGCVWGVVLGAGEKEAWAGVPWVWYRWGTLAGGMPLGARQQELRADSLLGGQGAASPDRGVRCPGAGLLSE